MEDMSWEGVSLKIGWGLHNSLFLEDSQVNTVDSRILDSKGPAKRVSSVATLAKSPVRSGSHLHDIQA